MNGAIINDVMNGMILRLRIGSEGALIRKGCLLIASGGQWRISH